MTTTGTRTYKWRHFGCVKHVTHAIAGTRLTAIPPKTNLPLITKLEVFSPPPRILFCSIVPWTKKPLEAIQKCTKTVTVRLKRLSLISPRVCRCRCCFNFHVFEKVLGSFPSSTLRFVQDCAICVFAFLKIWYKRNFHRFDWQYSTRTIWHCTRNRAFLFRASSR